MRLLLDTHVALWAVSEPERLTAPTREAIQDATSEVLVSAASVWEVAIKASLGKLRMDRSLRDELDAAAIATLAITAEHGEAAGALPLHHRDPYDRMLIAQATIEGLTIVTRDQAFEPYGVPLLSA